MNPQRRSNETRFRPVVAIAIVGMLFCLGSTAQAQQSPAAQVPPAEQATASLAQDQTPESLHLVVGHSMLIRTPGRIKRILTGNPTVVESVVTSPHEVVITAKQTGGSSLLLWDETGQSRVMDVSADLDVGSLRNAFEQAYPGLGVEIVSEEGKVALVGTVPSAAVAEQMAKMAGNFTKDVVNGLQVAAPPHQKQVLLKVRFAEADRQKLTAFAVNLFSTGATNTIGTISTQQFGNQSIDNSGNSPTGGFKLSDLLNVFLFRPDINLGATIKDLQQKNILQILAEPNLLAISGEKAQFLAGGEFPYPVVQSTGGNVGGITIVFKPFGVKLEFIGIIGENNTIKLKVAPEVSSLDFTNAVTISGFVLPAIQTRRAETVIELKDGQTFGIAGLLDERTTVQLGKVPGIADIPILGELFKSRNVNRTNNELVVLVTPIIVDPASEPPHGALPDVNMPVQNLNIPQFDQKLPLPAKPEQPASPQP